MIIFLKFNYILIYYIIFYREYDSNSENFTPALPERQVN